MSQEMAPGMPSEPTGSSVGASGTPNVKLDTSKRVNFGIDTMRALLTSKGWSIDYIRAQGKFFFDFPISRFRAGIGSMVIFNYLGNAYQYYDSATELDPTGSFLSAYGSYVVGMPTTPGMTQSDLIGILATALTGVLDISEAGPFSWIAEGDDVIHDTGTDLDGVFGSLSIKINPSDALRVGPYANDRVWIGNIIGGGAFLGATKGGGWQFTSRYANDGDTQIRIRATNGATNNLEIQAYFLNGLRTDISTDLAPVILPHHFIHKRNNFVMLGGTWHFAIFPTNYSSPFVVDSIEEVEFGTSDYWICMPKVPNRQRYPVYGLDPKDTGITYAAFEVRSPSSTLCANVGAYAVSSAFVKGALTALDVGMSILPVNSMGIAAGRLATTSELPIQLTPFVALTEGSTLFEREHGIPYVLKGLSVVGFIADAFLLTEYAKPGTIMYRGSNKYMAYRAQMAPCEVTLWYLIL